MLTTNIKYAVGIDFGHGETSFSYYNISWGKDIAGQEPTQPTVISLGDGNKTIPSIYLYNKGTDQMFIGRTAGINYGQLGGNTSNYVYGVSFKKPISNMSEEEKFFFKRYMMEVKKVIQSNSPVTLKDEDIEKQIKQNYVVVIARPSGWSKTEDNLYINLAKEANLPIIGIWPESRASIMRFISKDDATSVATGECLSIDDINMIHDGCVLMDIGSSTTDFSYVNKRMNYPIDDNGNDCGGQIIDEILLQYVLNLSCNAEVRKDILESFNDSLYNSLLFEIRLAKESLFSGEGSPGLHVRADYDSPTLSDEQVRCRFKDCPLETVIKLINEGLSAFNITPVGRRFNVDDNTYPELVKKAVRNGFIPTLGHELSSFITNHVISDSTQRINCFILTGGTSKLFKILGIDSYFKTTILEEIGLSECNVYMDYEPSTSVSDGLALVGRNYALFKGCSNDDPSLSFLEKEKAKGLKNQLDELVRKKLETISADSVKDAIANEIRDRVMSKATSAVDEFAGYHDVNPSLDDLKDDLREAISKGCANSGETISRHILACLRGKLDETSGDILKLVKKYTVQDINMPSTDKYSSISNISINVNVDNIINDISTRVSGQVIVAMLYLMLFPLATVIWGLTSIIDIFSGNATTTFDEFFDNFIDGADGPLSWVSSRKRLRWERERVQTKFNEKKSDISYDTYGKLKEQLSGIETIVNSGIKETIEDYKNDAYKAIERVFK